MNDYSYQSSGVKYGLILNPSSKKIVIDYDRSFDIQTAWPMKKESILDFKHIEGLSIRELKDYNGIIEDNHLIFVMYDTIPAFSTQKEQTIVRYKLDIYISKSADERLIERIIGENLYTELRARKIKYENIIRAKAFLEKYKYGFFEKNKNYLGFI